MANALLARLKRWLPRPVLVTARKQFDTAGLGFPQIPAELAARMRQQKKWWFTSRQLEEPPYHLDYYTHEFDQARVADYVVLSHDGHGANSYAIQYYLVQPGLGLFLHLAWGGIYAANDKAAENIAACFAVADRIVAEAQSCVVGLQDCSLKVVACDFYGSYWSVAGIRQEGDEITPLEVLNAALEWLTTR